MNYRTRYRIAFGLVVLLFFGVIAATLADRPTIAVLCVAGLPAVVWAVERGGR